MAVTLYSTWMTSYCFVPSKEGRIDIQLLQDDISTIDKWVQQNHLTFNSAKSKYMVASFPGPTQLSVASSTEKWERAWYNLSHDVGVERRVEKT